MQEHPSPTRTIPTAQERPATQPTVGRIVHYVSYGTPGGEYEQECRAAIVTEVPGEDDLAEPGEIGLAVLNPTGMFFNRFIRRDDSGESGGTWHWPERA